ncbi:MAG: DNA-binding protein [Clostridia bacterium]|nr:DNA-binding protein [Clostridia bacterium]
MKDDLHFLRLWDLYSPLLTATQREITDLYFNYDLSLGEIAEQKGVSRQSVSDCLNKCRKQLESYDEKLGFAKALDELSEEYSAYMTTVERFIESESGNFPALGRLKEKLDGVHEAFGAETVAVESGEIVGKVFR